MSRLNMNFDETFDGYITDIKENTGLTQTTELVRFLIKSYHRMLEDDNPLLGSAIRHLKPKEDLK